MKQRISNKECIVYNDEEINYYQQKLNLVMLGSCFAITN